MCTLEGQRAPAEKRSMGAQLLPGNIPGLTLTSAALVSRSRRCPTVLATHLEERRGQ